MKALCRCARNLNNIYSDDMNCAYVKLVGCCGLAAELQTVDWRDQGSSQSSAVFETWAVSFNPLGLCLSEGTKSCWSLLQDVNARGSKKSHMG